MGDRFNKSGALGLRMLPSPSPRPSPLGRGRTFAAAIPVHRTLVGGVAFYFNRGTY